MKKTVSLVLCAVLLLSLAVAALAGPPPQSYMDFCSAASSVISADKLTEETLTDDVEAKILKAIAKRDACQNEGISMPADLLAKVNAVEEKYNELLDARNNAGTTDPVTPPAGGETPETGDKIMVVVAVMVLAMTGMVVLVSKKRAI